jgi:hypothetical protein
MRDPIRPGRPRRNSDGLDVDDPISLPCIAGHPRASCFDVEPFWYRSPQGLFGASDGPCDTGADLPFCRHATLLQAAGASRVRHDFIFDLCSGLCVALKTARPAAVQYQPAAQPPLDHRRWIIAAYHRLTFFAPADIPAVEIQKSRARGFLSGWFAVPVSIAAQRLFASPINGGVKTLSIHWLATN